MCKTYSTTFCLFSFCSTDVGNKEMLSYLCCLQSHYSCLLSQNPFTIRGFTEKNKQTLLSPYAVKFKIACVCAVPFQFVVSMRMSEHDDIIDRPINHRQSPKTVHKLSYNLPLLLPKTSLKSHFTI